MKVFNKLLFPSSFAIFLILFLFLGFTLHTAHVYAQSPSYTQPNAPIASTQDLSTLVQTVTNEVLVTATCQLGGINPERADHKCLTYNQKSGRMEYSSGSGLLGVVTNLVVATYNIPVNSQQYVAYLGDNFAPFGQRAYAQGVGFVGLHPLLGLWVQFRNIVYLIFVILFVIVGFAIMLRVKIDPRTVMTIENQLPKLIIGILLVTFSYAIAGFLIDLMWLLTFFMINILSSVDANIVKGNNIAPVATGNLFQNPFGYANEILNTGSWGGILGMAGAAGRGVHDVIASMFSQNNVNQLGLNPPGASDCGNTFFLSGLCNLGQVIGNAVGAVMGFVFQYIISWIIGVLAILVILIALLVTMFRVWFALLKAYIFILLDVILAPFWVALGILPGSPAGFGGWLRDIGANLLAFPATVFAFVLARVLVDNFSTPNATGTAGVSLFVPPLIGNPNGTGTDNPLGGFIALALIFITPTIVQQVRDVLKSPQNKYFGAGVAGALGAGTGFTRLPGKVGQLGYTLGGLGNIPLVNRLGFLPKGGASGHKP